MEQFNEDLDWDYYDYGQKEQQNLELMKGIAQFNNCVAYQSPKVTEKSFTYFNITQHINNFAERYSTWAKESEILQSFTNTIEFKKESNKIQEDLAKITVPAQGQGVVLDKSKDSRIKFGGIQSTFPKVAIGVIVVTFKGGKKLRGTAFMIGPNHALTSANLFFDRDEKSADNNRVSAVQFYPGFFDNAILYPTVEVARVLVMEEFKGSASPEQHDLALIITAEPIGFKTGWFGLARLPKETLASQKVVIAGYSTLNSNELQLI